MNIVLIGYRGTGKSVVAALLSEALKMKSIGMDAEIVEKGGLAIPEIVEKYHAQGHPARYGDAEDQEFPGSLPLNEARWVVSTLSSRSINLTLLHALRNHGYKGNVALTAHSEMDFDLLSQSGADKILLPFRDASKEVANVLTGTTVST